MKKIAADKNYRMLKKADQATYQKTFNALVDYMFKQAKKPKKDGLFSWEIYKGSKGNYFQVNMLNQEATQMLQPAYYLSEIARKHLGVKGDTFQMQDRGQSGWMSWMLPAK